MTTTALVRTPAAFSVPLPPDPPHPAVAAFAAALVVEGLGHALGATAILCGLGFIFVPWFLAANRRGLR